VCAANTDAGSALAVTVINDGGNKYALAGDQLARNVGAGTYHFSGIPSAHPMKVWDPNSVSGCVITMASCDNVISTDYCHGSARWTIGSGCEGHNLSLRCSVHGAIGGTDRLSVTSEC